MGLYLLPPQHEKFLLVLPPQTDFSEQSAAPQHKILDPPLDDMYMTEKNQASFNKQW